MAKAYASPGLFSIRFSYVSNSKGDAYASVSSNCFSVAASLAFAGEGRFNYRRGASACAGKDYSFYPYSCRRRKDMYTICLMYDMEYENGVR